ncbi:non-catalytic module family expn protein [Moniliophthora roreri MCA 2997]|uniref:Non-catalytic module family expn protein n=1 Tax=Moniliophthora roreri (strain MCA 2997) TaxID=1381753 RepID=V2XGL4_MONRO|nr:non-catalytic module family expn protein [Moniliophthora roreri MCA 2997]
MRLANVDASIILATLSILVPPALCVFGDATYYRPGGERGACGAPNADSDIVVALPVEHYNNGENCWKHIGVWYDGNYVDAAIVDSCPTCGPNDIDLSEGAFRHLADLETGRMRVSWEIL